MEAFTVSGSELSFSDAEDLLRQLSAIDSSVPKRTVDEPPVPPEVQRWKLGAGEAAVLSFCLANPGFRAVLDDLRGRRCALALGLPLSGTLGLIIIPVAKPLIAAIRGFGYYIHGHLLDAALRQVGETWEE